MKCLAFCTAESYLIPDLIKDFEKKSLQYNMFEDVIHLYDGDEKNIFFFPYGCTIMWGITETEKVQILQDIKPFEIKPTDKVYDDDSTYFYNNDEKTFIKEETDEIFLESNDVLIKLSISHALSQSVKLSSFEDTVSNTIKNNRHLTDEFAAHGSTSLSRKRLAKKIGALFNERISINLHSDLLDTPEFFWRKPRYEPYYHMTVEFLDIAQRLEILHTRLNVLDEVYKILSEELKHLHSSRLELIVIYLIFIEVMLVILKDFLKLV
ncbi:MAG: RMD1 family protein [Alphaproteobacteria bacterium]